MPDLVHACLDLLVDGEHGVWHLANAGDLTWAELARAAARLASVSTGSLRPRPSAELRLCARRPRHRVLASERGQVMSPLEDALERFYRDCEVSWQPPASTRAA